MGSAVHRRSSQIRVRLWKVESEIGKSLSYSITLRSVVELSLRWELALRLSVEVKRWDYAMELSDGTKR